ncbi:MAG: deoxynucleoside kinase [Ignavibacteriaceae bacterium]|jgi:deoxyadenosine/deoxycytidine kinase|nr:deoxynucleoside kinase [Ignavibacterium sp.]MCU0364125.1 deoxynucleoside kinase [Ignavibacteriaceae bacterium]
MSRPYYIAVSGLMGSGKSTLAEGLSSFLGWELAQPTKNSQGFLSDLFKDMDRWAFEVQISFLTSKAFAIMHMVELNKNFILDRSLYEDSMIFAEYFYSKNKIDQRGYYTYKNLFEHFNISIKAPDLIIHCDCPLKTIKKRIEVRNKEFQKLYPVNHLEDINKRYIKWVKEFKKCPFYKLNTEKHDLRDKKIMQHVVEEVAGLLNSRSQSQFQLNLFDNPQTPFIPKYLEPIYSISHFKDFHKSLPINIKPKKYSTPAFPYAYIAAPFTSKANYINDKESDNILFQSDPLHGEISLKSEFRKMLLGVEQKLRYLNIRSVLPHRDVSRWGKKYISSNEVFESCTFHVTNCSLFVGIVGESNGSHYELGLAIALKKPVILIKCKEINNSYISNGINDTFKNVKVLYCNKIKEIPKLISSNDCQEYLVKQSILNP